MAVPKRNRVRRICFTLNNYEDDELAQLEHRLSDFKYVIGKEKGAKNGTPHLQGYVDFGKLKEWNAAKDLISERAHLEKCKGSAAHNWAYCTKDGDYVANMEQPVTRKKVDFETDLRTKTLEAEFSDVAWRPWQQDVISTLENEPDKRIIHWFWESTGNVGKSYLTKYLCLTRNVVACTGRADNVFNQVNMCLKNKKIPTVILADVPRASMDTVSYVALEACKNGCLYSGKYEGGLCVFPIPHVIVFANCPPNKSKLSEDRWNIINIEHKNGDC